MVLDDIIEYSLRCLSLDDVLIRPFQKHVIESYTKGLDTYCVAGTGCGKSHLSTFNEFKTKCHTAK